MSFIYGLLVAILVSYVFDCILYISHRLHIELEEYFVSSVLFDRLPKWFFNFLFHWFVPLS